MLPWKSNGLEVENIPIDEPYGFIYQITYDDGTYYYGKKAFYSFITLPPLKSGEPREGHIAFSYKNGSGKRKPIEKVKKESNWKTYTGSTLTFDNLTIVEREILAFARSKRELTYLEAKCLFQTEALEDPLCRNENINGLWYRDNLI